MAVITCILAVSGADKLQRYRDNKAIEHPFLPEADEPALPSRVVKLSDDMLGFAEEPRPVIVLGEDGKPLTAGDPHRFFEASWMHKYKGKYYFSYSTGDTHLLCYAVGDNPYGPFVYQGVILTPVVGWTTHHSIAEYKGKWYLFHHDCVPSLVKDLGLQSEGGRTGIYPQGISNKKVMQQTTLCNAAFLHSTPFLSQSKVKACPKEDLTCH